MAAILSRPQCVKNLPMVHGTHKLFLDPGLAEVIGCLGGSGGGCWGWHATDVLPSTWECLSLCFNAAEYNYICSGENRAYQWPLRLSARTYTNLVVTKNEVIFCF